MNFTRPSKKVTKKTVKKENNYVENNHCTWSALYNWL